MGWPKETNALQKAQEQRWVPQWVKEPPMFATRKMKNTIVWTLCLRWWSIARHNGRMSNMAAPVVPIQLARMVPNSKIPVLSMGVPTRRPFNRMPPLTVNSANSKMIKGRYSSSMTCSNSKTASSKPKKIVNGTKKASAQKMLTLPKLSCQKCGYRQGHQCDA